MRKLFAVTFVGAMVAAGFGGIAGAAPDEGPRFSLSATLADCPAGLILSTGYDDHVDGHRPVAINESVTGSAGEIWSHNELNQVQGDYYNARNIDVTDHADEAPFTYTVTITYDDGVSETRSVQPIAETCGDVVAPIPDSQRFDVKAADYSCPASGATFIAFIVMDRADGHIISGAEVTLTENGTTTFAIPVEATGLSSVTSDVIGQSLPFPLVDVEPSTLQLVPYTLTITATYEDGVSETHARTIDLGALCGAAASPDSPVAGTLPATR